MAQLTTRRTVTPPINTSGFYQVYQPFVLSDRLTYRCDAIRSFSELAKRDIDVYVTYYKPFGISEADYQKDLDLNASIVTLISSEGEFVYVPNTYIEAYPGMSGVSYQRTVLVVEMGPLPESADVTYLLPEVESLVSSASGTSAKATVAVVPLESPLTHEEHQQLEGARRGALALRTSLVEENATLTARNDELTRQVDELMAIIASRPEFVAD
jgi:hypothetical protein